VNDDIIRVLKVIEYTGPRRAVEASLYLADQERSR